MKQIRKLKYYIEAIKMKTLGIVNSHETGGKIKQERFLLGTRRIFLPNDCSDELFSSLAC